MSLSCFISSMSTAYIIVTWGRATPVESLRLLGYWPVSPEAIAKSFTLTALLFAGPLFEKGIVEGGWREWIRGRWVGEVLGSWIGWRNYIAVSLDHDSPSASSPLTLSGAHHGGDCLPVYPDSATLACQDLSWTCRLPYPALLWHCAHPSLLRIHSNTPPHSAATRPCPGPCPIRLYLTLRLLRYLSLLAHRFSASRDPRS